MASNDPNELYLKYRPKLLSEVIGQDGVVAQINTLGQAGKFPHCILLHGPAGCGKTTIGRILRRLLGCGDNTSDFIEYNSASFRGIDTVRDITSTCRMAPVGGACRIWLIDEVHQMTKDAQEAFLKIMEDTPRHVYFIFCTTEPAKLKKSFVSRCTEFALKALTSLDMRKLIQHVLTQEQAAVPPAVLTRLIEYADGCPRKALVALHQVLQLKDPAAQMEAIPAVGEDSAAFPICQAIFRRAGWGELGGIVGRVLVAEGNEVESLRHMVLNYFRSVLLNPKNAGAAQTTDHAARVIHLFSKPFYDSKAPGFVLACYQAVARPEGR